MARSTIRRGRHRARGSRDTTRSARRAPTTTRSARRSSAGRPTSSPTSGTDCRTTTPPAPGSVPTSRTASGAASWSRHSGVGPTLPSRPRGRPAPPWASSSTRWPDARPTWHLRLRPPAPTPVPRPPHPRPGLAVAVAAAMAAAGPAVVVAAGPAEAAGAAAGAVAGATETARRMRAREARVPVQSKSLASPSPGCGAPRKWAEFRVLPSGALHSLLPWSSGRGAWHVGENAPIDRERRGRNFSNRAALPLVELERVPHADLDANRHLVRLHAEKTSTDGAVRCANVSQVSEALVRSASESASAYDVHSTYGVLIV